MIWWVFSPSSSLAVAGFLGGENDPPEGVPPPPPPGGAKNGVFLAPPRNASPGPPGEGPDPPRLTPPCRPPRARGVFTVFRPIIGEKKVNAGGGAFFRSF